MDRGIEQDMNYMEELPFGTITSGLAQNTLVLRIIEFVYSQLPDWRDESVRPKKTSEKPLNIQLCAYLNTIRTKNDFPMVNFSHEEPQVGHATVDISASPQEEIAFGAGFYNTRFYNKYTPLVVFECKRLPTPGKDRENEYVTGFIKKSGGIQRFKIGLHGANHDIVAMIGYLQANTPHHWYNTINQWIIDLSNGTMKDICIWNTGEILECFEEDSSKGIASCRSTHAREGNIESKILIRHLWVTMN